LPALRSLLESFNDTQFLPAADTAVWGNALIQRSSEERLPPACEYRVDIMGTVFTWHSQAQHYVDALGPLAQMRPDELRANVAVGTSQSRWSISSWLLSSVLYI